MSGIKDFNSPDWVIHNAGISTLGNAVYSQGNRFVTSGITFSPYKGSIECRNLKDGSLL